MAANRKSKIRVALIGIVAGFAAALLLTFVLPSDHDHDLSSIWTDHLLYFTLVPLALGVAGWLTAGKGR